MIIQNLKKKTKEKELFGFYFLEKTVNDTTTLRVLETLVLCPFFFST